MSAPGPPPPPRPPIRPDWKPPPPPNMPPPPPGASADSRSLRLMGLRAGASSIWGAAMATFSMMGAGGGGSFCSSTSCSTLGSSSGFLRLEMSSSCSASGLGFFLNSETGKRMPPTTTTRKRVKRTTAAMLIGKRLGSFRGRNCPARLVDVGEGGGGGWRRLTGIWPSWKCRSW
ncbi:MAG: hypothetical protein EB079_03530 [Verrucomicrobia bacterium]|nr:hypothetical protein [Verrucomicrobiota bacterium]